MYYLFICCLSNIIPSHKEFSITLSIIFEDSYLCSVSKVCVASPAASRCVLGVQVGSKQGEESHWTKRHCRGKKRKENVKSTDCGRPCRRSDDVIFAFTEHYIKVEIRLRPSWPLKICVPQICEGTPGRITRGTHYH